MKFAFWMLFFSGLGMLLPLVVATQWLNSGVLGWLLDLAVHWQWLYGIGWFAGVVMLLRQDWRWLGLLVFLLLPWLTAAAYLPVAEERADVETPTILDVRVANVHFSNRDARPLMTWLTQHPADLIALVEVSPAYFMQLGEVPGYPYRYLLERNDPFGLGLLSRYPLHDMRATEDALGIPRLQGVLQWREQSVALSLVHPMPPLSAFSYELRDQVLKAAASAVVSTGEPALMLGDFNATPWSSGFMGLQQQGLMQTGRLRPTWPSLYAAWFGIPIDHILATQRWRQVGFEVGPALGSDHLPIAVQLRLPVQE